MHEKLKQRLLKILSNDEEVEDSLVATIANEATQIVGQRELEEPFVLDIAIYRYLLVKGALMTDAYEEQYRQALKRLERAKHKTNIGDEHTDNAYGIKSGQRKHVWI